MRIIPARAGFTPPCDPDIPSSEDHPRSRGVYGIGMFIATFAAGSSPLARGLLHETVMQFAQRRIIPARAGFTSQFHTVNRQE